jgi:prepilin-type N-terminal cleavage/methylation domain-containing protein
MNEPRIAKGGFSLLEILIVVAVIGILATLVLSYITGTSEYATQVVARQQQAQLQTALDNWVAATASSSGGLAAARNLYNNQANKLLLLSNYLQTDTFARFTNTGNKVRSAALAGSKASLEFTAMWSAGGSPTVTWNNSP